jgi:hypothetical protein
VAARALPCTGCGMPLALEGEEETRKTARSPSREPLTEETPMAEPICQPELTRDEDARIARLRRGPQSVAG